MSSSPSSSSSAARTWDNSSSVAGMSDGADGRSAKRTGAREITPTGVGAGGGGTASGGGGGGGGAGTLSANLRAYASSPVLSSRTAVEGSIGGGANEKLAGGAKLSGNNHQTGALSTTTAKTHY